MIPFSAVVLTGGYSRRMGQDKARLQHEGLPLLAHQLRTLDETGAAEILISCRAEAAYRDFGYPLVFDSWVRAGPLAGIEAALKAARHQLLLVLAVDLPRMTAPFLRSLHKSCQLGTGVVPAHGSRYEPLAGFYPRETLSVATQHLTIGNHALQHFVRQCLTEGMLIEHRLTASERGLFLNWNRESDITGGSSLA
jgi:molybdopterin-guanine dinucleotide biosynthesis protein A